MTTASDSSDKKILPSVYGIARSIEPSHFSFYAVYPKAGFDGLASLEEGVTAEVRPLGIEVRACRATQSGYSDQPIAERIDPKSKNSLVNANLQSGEEVALPADTGILLLKGCVKFLSRMADPVLSDRPEFTAAVASYLAEYDKRGGLAQLAIRYLLNIVSGRWMWRNAFGDNLQIRIQGDGMDVTFDDRDVDLSKGFGIEAIHEAKQAVFLTLAAAIGEALAGRTPHGQGLLLKVQGSVELGAGALCYPSQAFASADGNDEGSRGKKLSALRRKDGTPQPILTYQKVGNAIRTIDTWYGEAAHDPIVVEPYGVNTFKSEVRRQRGNDLYSYLKAPNQLLADLKENEEISPKHHFVVACLIRGGSYQFKNGSGSKSKKAAKETETAKPEGSSGDSAEG